MASKNRMELMIDRMIDACGCRTQAALAAILGKHPTQVTSWKNQAGPSSEFLQSLDFFLTKHPVNKKWILTGEGPKDAKCGDVRVNADIISKYLNMLEVLIERGDPKDDGKIAWIQRKIDALENDIQTPEKGLSLKAD